MQAIETRFIGPTDCRGQRVKAICDAGSITIAWDYAVGVDENHDAAALALAAKLGWEMRMHRGTVPSNRRGNVYVFSTSGSAVTSGSEVTSSGMVSK